MISYLHNAFYIIFYEQTQNTFFFLVENLLNTTFN